MKLDRIAAPSLPLASAEYDSRATDAYSNVLRLFFNRFTPLLNALTGVRGGRYINMPYGAFQDATTQTALANTPTAFKLGTVDWSNGVSVVALTRITAEEAGVFNLQWSAQFQNADNILHDAHVWLRVNGVDLAGSNGMVSVPNSHAGGAGHTIAGWNYFLRLDAGDYVELYWATDSAQVTVPFLPAQTTPYPRPATASIIATLAFVSEA